MTVVNPAAGTVGGQQTSSLFSSTEQTSMGKEDFLRLLVAQLENQDPLKPMENTEFVAQLAQFSSLEQLVTVSDGMTGLQMAQMGMSNLQAAELVGQNVMANGDTFNYDGSGGTDLGFDLGADASNVTVTIRDEAGGIMRTIELGENASGPTTLNWDGLTDSGTAAAGGRYTMEITAEDVAGNPIEASTRVTGEVTGVYYDTGIAELEIDGVRIRLGDIVSVSDGSDDAGGEP